LIFGGTELFFTLELRGQSLIFKAVYEKVLKRYFIPMENHQLIWTEETKKEVFNCPIFSIWENICRSPKKDTKTFTVMHAPDWAIIIPVIDTPEGRKFVMVRQWRHGSKSISLEFPGGVFEHGEKAEQAAARELQEETAYRPGKIQKIGEFSPNPAIMANRVHFFLAEELRHTGKQNLDDDEYIEVELVKIQDVFKGLGTPPYVHALMGTAFVLYLQKTAKDPGNKPLDL
jgi:8-oxo-dGTP pyrophosphatase MutT (NUDIX family)